MLFGEKTAPDGTSTGAFKLEEGNRCCTSSKSDYPGDGNWGEEECFDLSGGVFQSTKKNCVNLLDTKM